MRTDVSQGGDVVLYLKRHPEIVVDPDFPNIRIMMPTHFLYSSSGRWSIFQKIRNCIINC